MSSEACCPTTCVCADWLTAFCDYTEVTHTYCGTETTFEKARIRDMPQQDVNVEAGVHQADRQIEISLEEQNIESGIGAMVVDEDGLEWVVYRVQKIKAFCLLRLWARNLTACFSLTDRIEIYEMQLCGDDCSEAVKPALIARMPGRILVDGGNQQFQDDSEQMQVQYQVSLSKWPAGDHPEAAHRLKSKQGWFRVVNFRDGGPFVPYSLTLEKIHDQC